MCWAAPFPWGGGRMALKIYRVGELTYQFEEGTQPAGAVEIKAQRPQTKQRTPRNKQRTPKNKAAADAD